MCLIEALSIYDTERYTVYAECHFSECYYAERHYVMSLRLFSAMHDRLL